ncbi:response regulator [Brevibacillus dissolubilis]|uniref:response regulator n=1 Tax=Brevibacillus dissolubilis TaxID=1844116 RepID=UPI0011164958|nr:response regulator [Brevibacillus dissolubilis]
MSRFFIMDDDPAARRMLAAIIEDNELGMVSGEAEDGYGMESVVIRNAPDILLIDLLMPKQDGIATIQRLSQMGFGGKIVMLSQVEHKEMVSEAYMQGVEYFLHKPINRVEVLAVLRKVMEKIQLERSVEEIRRSLAWLGTESAVAQEKVTLSTAELVRATLTNLGVVGEAGSRDMTRIIEYLAENEHVFDERHFPSLQELYIAILPGDADEESAKKEIKATVQRIRRTVGQALMNVASMGLTDFANPVFEQYATTYFDFADVRQKMREIEADEQQTRVRLNLKKFLYALYLDVVKDDGGKKA